MVISADIFALQFYIAIFSEFYWKFDNKEMNSTPFYQYIAVYLISLLHRLVLVLGGTIIPQMPLTLITFPF